MVADSIRSNLFGKNEFKDIKDKLSYSTDKTMSNKDKCNKTLKFIKIDLIGY